MALLLGGCAPNYSEGERVGLVTKLSNKGLIWKSWEGSMNQGGMKEVTDDKGRASVVPNTFDFNASDPAVIEKLRDAAKTGRRVELVYRQWFIAPLTIENSRVVVSVKDAQ